MCCPPRSIYDVLLSPFVLYAVARAAGIAAHGPVRAAGAAG